MADTLTSDQLETFRRQLRSLCDSFDVFIRRSGERRDSPHAPVFYYEVELSVKVQLERGQWFRENGNNVLTKPKNPL